VTLSTQPSAAMDAPEFGPAALDAPPCCRAARAASRPDMMSIRDACALAGLSDQTIREWAARGCCIAITEQPGDPLKLPRWQFQPRVLKALPRVAAALGRLEGAALLAYVETPAATLGGATPRRLLEQGHADRVIADAARQAD